MPTPRIAAILPAAGGSRRMGRPKLLLPVHGGPMVAAVVNALLGGGAEEVVLVTSPDNEDLRGWARRAGVECAVNPDPSRGMLTSIQAGIAALGGAAELARQGTILLVSPADLPNLQAETVMLLVRRMLESAAPLALPVYRSQHGQRSQRGHPLAIAPALIPEIDTLDPGVGLKQLRDRHLTELLEVEVEDAGVVQDVDTPEDYEAAKS